MSEVDWFPLLFGQQDGEFGNVLLEEIGECEEQFCAFGEGRFGPCFEGRSGVRYGGVDVGLGRDGDFVEWFCGGGVDGVSGSCGGYEGIVYDVAGVFLG